MLKPNGKSSDSSSSNHRHNHKDKHKHRSSRSRSRSKKSSGSKSNSRKDNKKESQDLRVGNNENQTDFYNQMYLPSYGFVNVIVFRCPFIKILRQE